MATYSQWRKFPKLSRVYWVHGCETVLIDLVIQDIRKLVGPGNLDDLVLWADELTSGQLWDSIFQQPLVDGISRLVVVRKASGLTDFEPLKSFVNELKTQLANTHVVFVSDDSESSPAVDTVGARRAQVIRCSTPNADDLIALVQDWSGISETSARVLLDWTAGSLTSSWHLSLKLGTLDIKSGLTVSKELLAFICDEIPSTFVDSVVQVDKSRALAAAEALDADDVPGVCSLLELRLEQIEIILDYARSGGNLKTARGVPGVPYLAAKDLLMAVPRYDTARLRRCRGLLAILDAEARAGAQTGLLEAMIAVW